MFSGDRMEDWTPSLDIRFVDVYLLDIDYGNISEFSHYLAREQSLTAVSL